MGTPGGSAEMTQPPGTAAEQQPAATPPAQGMPASPTPLPTPAGPGAAPWTQPPAIPAAQQGQAVQTPAPAASGQPAIPDLPAISTARRGRLRAVLIAAVAIIAVVAIAVSALLAYGYAQAKQPIDATQALCADLKAQRYDAAYARLSPDYQARMPRDQFLAAARLHDAVDGNVTDCGLPGVTAGLSVNLGGDKTASFGARITRATRGSFEGTVTLVKDGGAWRIDRLDDALQGTDIGPLAAGQRLCAALVAGDYATAYSLYSTREQQSLGSAQAFADTYKNAFGGPLKLTGCAPDLKSYQALGPAAKLDVRLTVTESTTLGTQTIDVPTPVTLRFIQEGGTWKVDQFDLNIPNA